MHTMDSVANQNYCFPHEFPDLVVVNYRSSLESLSERHESFVASVDRHATTVTVPSAFRSIFVRLDSHFPVGHHWPNLPVRHASSTTDWLAYDTPHWYLFSMCANKKKMKLWNKIQNERLKCRRWRKRDAFSKWSNKTLRWRETERVREIRKSHVLIGRAIPARTTLIFRLILIRLSLHFKFIHFKCRIPITKILIKFSLYENIIIFFHYFIFGTRHDRPNKLYRLLCYVACVCVCVCVACEVLNRYQTVMVWITHFRAII